MPGSLLANTSRIYATYNTSIPDQFRADMFIKEFNDRWMGDGKTLPKVLTIFLPNDHGAGERPDDGYPFRESSMADNDLALMAHLYRRAGFGATYDELESSLAQGYEATVEQLLHPEDATEWDDDLFRRYHVDQNSLMLIESSQAYWLYRMINTKRPLEEKMALFWHGLFATAYGKLNHAKAVVNQTNTFRRHGLGSFQDLLLELSRDLHPIPSGRGSIERRHRDPTLLARG